MLIPLAFPPGFSRNGTALQNSGRWFDGSLVRWREGAMQPIGGWTERASLGTTTPVRGSVGWVTNSGNRWAAFGSSDKLHVLSQAGVVTDITPVGLTVGVATATVNLGYGGGLFGVGTFGTPRADAGVYSEATTWSLDTWGENLIAVSDADKVIYEWSLNVANDAVAVVNAPTATAALVTEERFLFALGADGDPRLVQWSDRENNTLWIPAATNEAGSYQIASGSRIMCGARVRGQALILTDVSAHTATYQGGRFVYGFQRVGEACGAVSARAVTTTESGAFWWSEGGFFTFAGGAVEPVRCEVLDFVMADLNKAQKSKVYAVTNSLFSEVWWFYPGQSSTECDRYAAYNYREGHWLIGAIDRTSGFDVGPLRNPVWVNAAGMTFSQENGTNWGGDAVFAESGPLSMGESVATVVGMHPDERTQGEVQAVFKAKYYPNGPESTYGPYAMGLPTDLLFTARQVALRVEGVTTQNWRVGVNNLILRQRGAR